MNNNISTPATTNTYFKVEFYRLNPVTGESEFDLKFASIKANSYPEAYSKLVLISDFDYVKGWEGSEQMNEDCDMMLHHGCDTLVRYNIVNGVYRLVSAPEPVAPAPVETKLERTVADVRVGDKIFLKEALLDGNDYGTGLSFLSDMYTSSHGATVKEIDATSAYAGSYYIAYEYISHVQRFTPKTSAEMLEHLKNAIAGYEEQHQLGTNQLKTIAAAQQSSVDCFYFDDVCYAGTFDNALKSYMAEILTSSAWSMSFTDYVQTLECFGDYNESDYSEYKVYTEDEANEACAESIKESVWAFNSNFLSGETGIAQEVFAAIQSNGKCESNNDAILSCISDIDSFVIAAISADGRGHFLSQYDGEENEQTVFGNTFYLYRNN